MLFDEFGEDFDSPDDVGDGAAAREVGDGTVKPLKDRSSDGKAGELLKDFVNEVARIEIRGDEDVSLTGDLVGFGVGVLRVAFVETNTRIDGGVELHFSGDKDIAFGEACKSFLSIVVSLPPLPMVEKESMAMRGLSGRSFLAEVWVCSTISRS